MPAERVVDFVKDNYKETHGSLKSFNRDGKDVAHMDVTDERTAEIIKDVCKKSHIPIDMQEKPRADGTCSYVAFCEVKNVDQLTGILKMASEQVLEEQKAMTKEITMVNDSDEKIFSQEFVKDTDIDYDKLQEASVDGVSLTIKDNAGKVLVEKEVVPGEDIKAKVKEKTKELNPKQKKTLKETIKDKKEQVAKKDRNRQRERVKQKNRSQSR